MVTIESFSKMHEKDVFTEKGLYCGKVSDIELDLDKFRVRALVIDLVKGSCLTKVVGSKRGIVVPFQMVNSVGDIIIIKNLSSSLPSIEELEREEAMGHKPVPMNF